MSYSEDIYQPRLQLGLEYQDFLCERLHRLGIVLQNIQSKKFQHKKENLLGLEIKFDRRFEKTGNLYIETAEKADPANANYVPSGIFRDDESWLYGIGNYSELFIFAKQVLKAAHKDRHHRRLQEVENETKTSLGFLIPRAKALAWVARHIKFEA